MRVNAYWCRSGRRGRVGVGKQSWARRSLGQAIGRPKALDAAKAALAQRMQASGEPEKTIAATLVSRRRRLCVCSCDVISRLAVFTDDPELARTVPESGTADRLETASFSVQPDSVHRSAPKSRQIGRP